jgi:predicted lysophospholipase L1 biosynthesis ABC-type transport system permease subunit
VQLVQQFWQDVRYALRQLHRAPGFTITAVLTLALGVGAITAIFTLIYQVMLRSLPITAPEQLYKLGTADDCCHHGGGLFGGDYPAGQWSVAAVVAGAPGESRGRTPEVGLRMALGADRCEVLKRALAQMLVGIALGVPLAFVLGRLMAAQLYNVSSYNPLILGGAFGTLVIAALLAAMLPARRAASIEPVQALRNE